MLKDKHGRQMTYLRLAVTDRCNLRCHYCMPECGIDFVSRSLLLSYEEMLRLCRILADEGITKVRITGGEPFVRKDLLPFMKELSEINGIEKVNVTTNGSLLHKHSEDLRHHGISSTNLSLDSLDREQFKEITRRDELPLVLESIDKLISQKMPLKVNMVVMGGVNTDQIVPMANLARVNDIEVRYIEEMPFNGTGKSTHEPWNYKSILTQLESEFGQIEVIRKDPGDTATQYRVEGFKGTLGIIPALSRTFCGGCNRLRITPQGRLKTCLYGNGVLDLRSMLRDGSRDEDIADAIRKAVLQKAKDGFEAESLRASGPVSESMATIGG